MQATNGHGRSISAQLVLAGPHPVAHNLSAAADARFLTLGATAFFSPRGYAILANELAWVWLPSGCLAAALLVSRSPRWLRGRGPAEDR